MSGSKEGSRTNKPKPGLSLEDSGRRRLRTQVKKIPSLEPYGEAAEPAAKGNKKDLRKLGEWIKAKQRAEAIGREEEKISPAPNPKYRPTKECPFADLPDAETSHWGAGVTAEQMAEMIWLRPQLVAQIRFVEWTAEGRLRHAAFIRLRVDKTVKDVRREA